MNQKEIRKQCEQLWARNKYYVLSKSHKVYLEIREYLKEPEIELEVLLQQINTVNELQESKKDFHNAILHIWGYFKNTAEKAEKVVNPPQNPVINKYFISEFSLLKVIPNPIRTQPMMLIANVAHGKFFIPIHCPIPTEIRYRRTHPKPPPTKTTSIF